MPVTVKLASAGPGSSGKREYPEADDVLVDENGCLLVTAGAGREERTVAVFNAEAWISAEVQ